MNKKDVERRLEAAEKQNFSLMEQNLSLRDEIKNLKSQLAEMQDEPEIPDKPEFEMDEKFYYLNSATGGVEDSYFDNDMNAIDFNMFHTEEDAQKFHCLCKLIAMMLHCKRYLDNDYIPDWKDGKYKYFAYRDPATGNFDAVAQRRLGTGLVAFSTAEKARRCADWLNEQQWKENS